MEYSKFFTNETNYRLHLHGILAILKEFCGIANVEVRITNKLIGKAIYDSSKYEKNNYEKKRWKQVYWP